MENLVHVFRRIISFDCTWVLFAHGSCVVVPASGAEPRRAARKILRESTDAFSVGSVIALTLLPGWVVTAPHPDVLTYVSPDDIGPAVSDVTIAYYGSAALGADARELRILHVESVQRRSFAKGSRPDNASLR